MQGKGLIKAFLILIVAVCLLQFFYFIPTNRVEKAADNYAAAQSKETDSSSALYKKYRVQYLDSVSGLEAFKIPFIKSYTYNDLKKQQLGLGLDLKGGMSSVLQVDLSDFLKSIAGRNANDVNFIKALEAAEKRMQTSQGNFVSIFVEEFRALAGEEKLARLFSKSEVFTDLPTNASDGEVERQLRQKSNETVKRTYELLKERIDKLGVAQPNISLDASRDLIVVEMPGIDNPERARTFLTKSAKLEFWETYRTSDNGVMAAFQNADNLSGSQGTNSPVMKDSIIFDELGNILDTVQVATTNNANASGTGRLLTALTLNPGSYSPAVMGVADKSMKNTIDEILATPEVKSAFPKNSFFAWSRKPIKTNDGKMSNDYELYMLKTKGEGSKAPLDGDVVTSGSQSLNPTNSEVEVILRMNASGAKTWADMTTKAANDGNREVAILLDGEVVSAPSVRVPIPNGVSSITGNFTVEEAVDFASILEVGKLPAGTTIIQEMNVGPSLGKANIKKSINSLLIGFFLVIVTMLAYYAGAGIIAILSLLLNVFLIFGTLSSFGTVLTLSGIAGIVLTIGMAVDANVIIFERIKEELSEGKSLKQAISDGFYHSYSAIIDANVTTFITAMILAYFGLGPVKGFAVVLMIGIGTSIFTSIFITRLMLDYWIDKGKDLRFWNSFSKGAFKNVNFDWISKRKIAYIFSSIIIVAGIFSMFTRGFDLGVDYKGGYSYVVQFTGSEGINAEKLRNELAATFEAAPIVKQVDTDNAYNITTSYLIKENTNETADKVLAKLHEGLMKVTGSNVTLDQFKNTETGSDKIHVISSTKVGPTIADDLKKSSFYAAIFALISVFLYILLRFNRWQYSAGALVAVFHDTLIILSLFSLLYGFLPFSLEIDQAFIAAILTIIGYSLNDTVIIFDRIREFFSTKLTESNDEVINLAINSTLSRTIMTSFTTILVILLLFLFGGASIKGFAFALLIGIVVGTYSSVFIAAPILHDLSSNLRVAKAPVTNPKKDIKSGKAVR